MDTTTPIRSPEPRRRSTRPRQAAAKVDPDQTTAAAPPRSRPPLLHPPPQAQPAPCAWPDHHEPIPDMQSRRNRATNAKQLPWECVSLVWLEHR